MTNIQKIIHILAFVCIVLATATYFINKDTERVVNKVVAEMQAEKQAKADKVIEETVIYQAESSK